MAFGLPRMLETFLKLRYPSARFEVVNAAMTGINSHVVRDIARDCAKANGDLWVIYMGNNEVVGPFGAGTVFSRQTPPLNFIRASLALKTTRLGQLLDAGSQRLHSSSNVKSEWNGMAMFLDHEVRADDPRMNRVYHHFQENLAEIIATGRRAGAGVVVSTIAVNLKDCAPFASAQLPTLDGSLKSKWQTAYDHAIRVENLGDPRAELQALNEAAQVDDTVAKLHFRRGECAFRLGDKKNAQVEFKRARDLDALRFRCDGRMNEIIRATAASHQVALADPETVFTENSADGLPGNELFYDHVPPTWEGNWLLARAIANQLAGMLPGWVTNDASVQKDWPNPEQCARALAWSDRNRHAALSTILSRMQNAPFTHQINHKEQIAGLTAELEKLSPALQPARLAEARETVEAAVVRSPNDAMLQMQTSYLRRLTGDAGGAEKAARRVTELQPFSHENWNQLANTLVQIGRAEEGELAFEAALRLAPDDFETRNQLAQVYLKMGRTNDALREFQHVLSIQPHFGSADLGIGEILEQQGKLNEARAHYDLALKNRIFRVEDLTALARFCFSKNWYEAGITNLQDALALNPDNAVLHTLLAEALKRQDRNDEAGQQLAAAARLDPSPVFSHFGLGLELGRQGKIAEAAGQFREVVRLKPDFVEGRINLGLALAKQGLNREALEQFEAALQLNPTNEMAAQQIRALRPHSSEKSDVDK